SGGPSGSSRSNDSAEVLEATSPAWAPPMPSAMTKTGARTKTESSLALRCRPVSGAWDWSVTPSLPPPPTTRPTSGSLETEDRVADLDRVAVDQLGLVLQLRPVQGG